MQPPFDRASPELVEGLRANGFYIESIKDFPFVLSVSKHERRFYPEHLIIVLSKSDHMTFVHFTM